MGWIDRFLGRGQAQEDMIEMRVARVLERHKDQMRVEVLTEVRVQMNRVFKVVDNLKDQVDGLTQERNALSRRLEQVERAQKDTNDRMKTLDSVVRESAAKNAKGFTEVTRRLSELSTAGAAASPAAPVRAATPAQLPGVLRTAMENDSTAISKTKLEP